MTKTSRGDHQIVSSFIETTGREKGDGAAFEFESLASKVHIWHASVEGAESHLAQLLNLLSEDEVRRSLRFQFARDRLRFVVARGVLRFIMGRYADTPPEQICFSYNRYGKPAIAGNPGRHDIRFNLSHSGACVLYAVTRGREVGVDVECVRPFENVEHIIERFFSDREKEEFRNLRPNEKDEAFVQCWARKEAYAKAVGMGLSLPFDQFSLLKTGSVILVEEGVAPMNGIAWRVRDIAVKPGWAAAVAVEGGDINVCSREWTW